MKKKNALYVYYYIVFMAMKFIFIYLDRLWIWINLQPTVSDNILLFDKIYNNMCINTLNHLT